jgi:hypothetical protein
MKRGALEGNAGALQPNAHLAENVIDEALVAGAVDQPVDDVSGQARSGDGNSVWCGHFDLLGNLGLAVQEMSYRGAKESIDVTISMPARMGRHAPGHRTCCPGRRTSPAFRRQSG